MEYCWLRSQRPGSGQGPAATRPSTHWVSALTVSEGIANALRIGLQPEEIDGLHTAVEW